MITLNPTQLALTKTACTAVVQMSVRTVVVAIVASNVDTTDFSSRKKASVYIGAAALAGIASAAAKRHNNEQFDENVELLAKLKVLTITETPTKDEETTPNPE